MKRPAKRELELFGTSFLDCICCGFGAVILLFMLVNARQRGDREAATEKERREVEARQVDLVILRKSVKEDADRRTEATNRLARAQAQAEDLRRQSDELAALERRSGDAAAASNELARVRAELAARKAELGRKDKDGRDEAKARDLAARAGDGRRQVVTDMRTDGRRVLFILESSGSMLGVDQDQALKFAALGPAGRKRSRKWTQAVDAVRWLVAGLPPESASVQIAAVNQEWRLLGGGGAEWVPTSDSGAVASMLAALDAVEPGRGGDLGLAFSATAAMKERPDLVYLVTDGLPTASASLSRGTRIDQGVRARLFDSACQALPPGIPVNIFLLPFEGDPQAAPKLWNLACRTGGSLQIPPENWP